MRSRSSTKIGVFLAAVISLCLSLSVFSASSPSVVLIVADDLGYGDSNAFWDESQIRTPALQDLADQGVMSSSYRTQPLCTASRSALMTGLFNAGFNQSGSAHNLGIDDRVTFLSEYLQRLGYQVGGFGKWHLGRDDGDHPLDRGFDEWIGFYGGAMPYHRSKAKDRVFDGKAPYKRRWEHSTDLFADEAIRFIRAQREKPFFLYLSFNAVHTPIWTPKSDFHSAHEDWLDKVRQRGVTDPATADYRALVEHMDARIGDVLNTLRAEGLERNTLVLFVSDNGVITPTSYYAAPQPGSNGPYRGSKATPYEGGIRVPFIASWPGRIPAGVRSDQAVLDADILPTVLEAAGIIRVPQTNGPRALDGRSLLALMQSPETVQLETRGTPSWLGSCFAYVKYPWKLLAINKRIGRPEAKGMDVTNGRLLFNLEQDPEETTDLSASNEELAGQLWEEYQDLYYSIRQPLNPDHDVPRRLED